MLIILQNIFLLLDQIVYIMFLNVKEETASLCNSEDGKNKILELSVTSYCSSVKQWYKNKGKTVKFGKNTTKQKPNKHKWF